MVAEWNRPWSARPAVRWVAALGSAKLADVVTTIVGLVFFGAIEGNPVGRSLIAHFGLVPGLVLGSAALVLFIVLVTEWGATAAQLAETDPLWPPRVRLIGYGLPVLLFTGAAVYNVALILSVG